MPEITGQQSVLVTLNMELDNTLPKSFATYRVIRKHPTVALARAIRTAAVVAGSWSIEADDEVDDEQIKFIHDQVMPVRESFMQSTMLGGIDFGWAPFEVVYDIVDGQIVLKKLKSLLHDITTILVTQDGTFFGFEQVDNFNVSGSGEVRVPVENSLNIPFEPEGTNWYGRSLLENIRNTFNEWTAANCGADRYDKKLAGSHWVVHYPVGHTTVNDVKTDNFEVAKTILQSLMSSGAVVIPRVIQKHLESDSKDGWEIEMMSDGTTGQANFVTRLGYLDTLMVRGLLIPERSLLEGKFGTKAEAGEHADLAITHMDIEHRHITRLFNWHVVNRLLVSNFGPDAENTIRVKPTPLSDEAIAHLRGVYDKILSNAGGFAEEFPFIDTDAIKDALEIPKSEEVAAALDNVETREDVSSQIDNRIREIMGGANERITVNVGDNGSTN